MKIIVLTGQIGAGKSTIAKALNTLGYNVYDSDDIVRCLQYPGHRCYRRIIRCFPNVTYANGQLDRAELSRYVFGAQNVYNLRLLNQIVHPSVFRAIWAALLRNSFGMRYDVGIPKDCCYVEHAKGVVLVIPLFFESKAFSYLPSIEVQVSNEAVQIERLRRRGLSEDESRKRISSYMSKQVRAEKASKVVFNDSLNAPLYLAEAIDKFTRGYIGGWRYWLVCHLKQECTAFLILAVLFLLMLALMY